MPVIFAYLQVCPLKKHSLYLKKRKSKIFLVPDALWFRDKDWVGVLDSNGESIAKLMQTSEPKFRPGRSYTDHKQLKKVRKCHYYIFPAV